MSTINDIESLRDLKDIFDAIDQKKTFDASKLDGLLRSADSWASGKKGKSAIDGNPGLANEWVELRRNVAELLNARRAADRIAKNAVSQAVKNNVQNAPVLRAVRSAGMTPRPTAKQVKESQLGSAFHNPYSFMPFASEQEYVATVKRDAPTDRDACDERFDGLIRLKLTTKSPLLTCHPVEEKGGKRQRSALAIGNDVIVPATGIRGALRSLVEVITGSAAPLVADHIYLRTGNHDNGIIGQTAFLVRVLVPGSSKHEGKVLLGETYSVLAQRWRLQGERYVPDGQDPNADSRSDPNNQCSLWISNPDNPYDVRPKEDSKHPYQLKLSGRFLKPSPRNVKKLTGEVKEKVSKRDAAFLNLKERGKTITLDCSFWNQLVGVNYGSELDKRQKDHSGMVRKDDLLWLILESPLPKGMHETSITSEMVKCISWTRWPRKGEPLLTSMPDHTRPCGLRDPQSRAKYGASDIAHDLFGQVSTDFMICDTLAFAGRVRPDNAVFKDAKCDEAHIAPLLQPHPSCRAFYRDNDDPKEVSERDKLRGFKVYRTEKANGQQEYPWLYTTQPVYQGMEMDKEGKNVSTWVHLVSPEQTGEVNVSLRGLERWELGLLLHCCSLPWRLGGGKPLGLGHVTAALVDIIDADGNRVSQEYAAECVNSLREQLLLWKLVERRSAWWIAAQKGVIKLRYPRAVQKNSEKGTRGGQAWFGRHATAKKDGDGLQELKDAPEQMANVNVPMPGQILPALSLSPDQPDDFLYAYDLIHPIPSRPSHGSPRPQRR